MSQNSAGLHLGVSWREQGSCEIMDLYLEWCLQISESACGMRSIQCCIIVDNFTVDHLLPMTKERNTSFASDASRPQQGKGQTHCVHNKLHVPLSCPCHSARYLQQNSCIGDPVSLLLAGFGQRRRYSAAAARAPYDNV